MAALVWLALQTTDELIRQLGSDDVAARDAAEAKLAAKGDAIEAELKKAAAEQTDAEIKGRVAGLLRTIAIRNAGPLIYVSGDESGAFELCRIDADGKNRRVIQSKAGRAEALSVSPDGRTLAYLERGALWTRTIDGTNPKKVVEAPKLEPMGAASLQWSPDGKRLLVNECFSDEMTARLERRAYVTGVDGKNVVAIGDPGVFSLEPSMSPDGSSIAFAMSDPASVELMDMDLYVVSSEGKDRRKLAAFGKRLTTPLWSPDGKTLYVAAHLRNTSPCIYAVPIGGGEPKEVAAYKDKRAVEDMAWRTGGKRLMYLLYENQIDSVPTVILRDLESGKDEAWGEKLPLIHAVAFSRNGAWMAFRSESLGGASLTSELYVMHSDDTNASRIVADAAAGGTMAWGPPIR